MKKLAIIFMLGATIYSLHAGGELVPFNHSSLTQWSPVSCQTFSLFEEDISQQVSTGVITTSLFKNKTVFKYMAGLLISAYIYSQRKTLICMLTKGPSTQTFTKPSEEKQRVYPTSQDAKNSDTRSDSAYSPSPLASSTESDAETDPEGYETCHEE